MPTTQLIIMGIAYCLRHIWCVRPFDSWLYCRPKNMCCYEDKILVRFYVLYKNML